MNPQAAPTRRCRVRYGTSLALGCLVVWSCGGNPAGAPGQGAANLPPQTNPAIASASNKPGGVVRALTGTISDAITGEPVGAAKVFIEGVTTTVTTTPIPATPAVPGEFASPKPGGGGGGGDTAPFTVAQVASASPAALPGAVGTPTAPAASGASPAPGASGVPSAAPVTPPPAGAPTPVPGASAPAPTGTPLPLKSVKADSQGKFQLSELPEGSYAITVYAVGYESQTFQGALPTTLDVKLRPLALPKSANHNVKGTVRQASNTPAGNVEVQVAALLGEQPLLRATTDDAGNFALGGLAAGNYAMAAWTTGLDGDIDAFAMVKEVPVALGREKRSVSPTLVLHAPTGGLLFAGTIEGTPAPKPGEKKNPNAVKPTAVRAYIRVGDGEIPLANVPVGPDGYFRLKLPNLPDGVSYHLVASGTTASGQTVYLHRYGQTASDPKLTFKLPDPPGAVSVVERSTGPAFSWEAKGADVAAYRLVIESIGDQADTLWQGWTTGTAIRLPRSKPFDLLMPGESYRYTLTAIKLDDKGKLDLAALNGQPWAASAMGATGTFEVPSEKNGPKPGAGPRKPLALPEPDPTPAADEPAPAASDEPLPDAIPTPKSKRIKPLTTL